MRRIEDIIVDLGVSNQFLNRNQNNDANLYPLNNVNARNNRLDPRILNALRTTHNGGGWMNGDRDVRVDDEFVGIYNPEQQLRPVYAIDCSSVYSQSG